MQLFGEVEAALTAKVDIDECHVRPQFLAATQCFRTGRGRADDRDALALQQVWGDSHLPEALIAISGSDMGSPTRNAGR